MTYTDKDLTIMEGLDHIRTRPAMYVGSVDQRGVNFLIKGVLESIPDSNIDLDGGREFKIIGQGPPFSLEIHPRAQKTFFEIAFTIIGTGRADSGFYLVILNALSEFLQVETVCGTKTYSLVCRKGKAESLQVRDRESKDQNVSLHFKLDSSIFIE